MDYKTINYPIYIISKGRYEKPLTAISFLKENIDFKIAVEPEEYEKYCNSIPKNNVLKLNFSNKGLGSFPARNFCWEHSVSQGYSHHFLFDDNIRGFCRLNNGKRVSCSAFDSIITLQNLDYRYDNISISGFNYRYFVQNNTKKPFYFNTHVYSGMLIKNNIKSRWRLKYNEDVDLNLQELTKGNCTLLLNAFLINKITTSSKMKGGNQDELYKNNDPKLKMLKSKSLQKVWPKYVKVVYRYGRPHHQVSWKKFFKQRLIKKKNYSDIVSEQTKQMRSIYG